MKHKMTTKEFRERWYEKVEKEYEEAVKGKAAQGHDVLPSGSLPASGVDDDKQKDV